MYCSRYCGCNGGTITEFDACLIANINTIDAFLTFPDIYGVFTFANYNIHIAHVVKATVI